MNQFIEMSPDSATRVCLAQYVGEVCVKCNHKYNSVDDIIYRRPVCAGSNENGVMLACHICFSGGTETK